MIVRSYFAHERGEAVSGDGGGAEEEHVAVDEVVDVRAVEELLVGDCSFEVCFVKSADEETAASGGVSVDHLEQLAGDVVDREQRGIEDVDDDVCVLEVVAPHRPCRAGDVEHHQLEAVLLYRFEVEADRGLDVLRLAVAQLLDEGCLACVGHAQDDYFFLETVSRSVRLVGEG